MDTMKEKITKLASECVENIAIVVTKSSIGRSISPLGYEVEIPEELLQEENK